MKKVIIFLFAVLALIAIYGVLLGNPNETVFSGLLQKISQVSSDGLSDLISKMGDIFASTRGSIPESVLSIPVIGALVSVLADTVSLLLFLVNLVYSAGNFMFSLLGAVI